MRFILICTIIVLSFGSSQAQEWKDTSEVGLKCETVAVYDTQMKENFLKRDSYFNFTQANRYLLKSGGFGNELYGSSFLRKTEPAFIPTPKLEIPDWKLMTLGVLLDAGQEWIRLNYGQ